MGAYKQGVFPPPLDDPHADEHTQPFWDAALQDRLVCAKCTNCGTFRLPPHPRCFNCQHDAIEWAELPGTGTIYTFTIVRHPLAPHLKEVVPFVSACIELDGTQGAGARMICNVTDVVPEEVQIGDKVRIWFDKVSDTYPVPRFRPA